MDHLSREDIEIEFDRAQDLYTKKNHAAALPILQRLADLGYAPAYFKLAQYEFYSGDRQVAQQWLARLEAAGDRGNAHACYLCYLAYRGGWTGQGRVVNNPIGSLYLLRAAELGHTYAQYTLAQELRSGANDQTKSEAGYLHWIEKAITGGSDDAIYDHIKWLDQKGRSIHPSLMADLDVLAQEWPNAAKLRDKLKRRTQR